MAERDTVVSAAAGIPRSGDTGMLIDEFLSHYDAVERHHIDVHAPPKQVYEAVRALDLSESRIIRWLFTLRELPGRLFPRGKKKGPT